MTEEIRNQSGERLDYTYHGFPSATTVVVIGHGVTGNKDRPHLIALAEAVVQAGMAAIRLSFSGCGDSEGDFGMSTPSKQVGDLRSVLDALKDRKTFYVGHSLGGAVGVITASADQRIRALVTLGCVVDLARFADTEFGNVTPGQGGMWDDPNYPLSEQFMNDMRTLGSIATLAPSVKVPWLLVHGTDDDVVPIQDSIDAFETAGVGRKLVRMEGADHVFSDDAGAEMVGTVVDWLRSHN